MYEGVGGVEGWRLKCTGGGWRLKCTRGGVEA